MGRSQTSRRKLKQSSIGSPSISLEISDFALEITEGGRSRRGRNTEAEGGRSRSRSVRSSISNKLLGVRGGFLVDLETVLKDF